jgi:hypothetical protein
VSAIPGHRLWKIALVIRHPASVGLICCMMTCTLLGCRPADVTPPDKLSLETTSESEVHMLTATPARPAKWSAKYDQVTLEALKRGAKRLVVAVEAYDPSPTRAGQLIVTLAPEDHSKRQELWRIGLHPSSAFDSKNQGVISKKFLMPIKDFANFVEGEELKLEVSFPPSVDPSSFGSARIRVELVDQKAP